MTSTATDQVRGGTDPRTELAGALRTGPFELAMRLALRASGLSLDRVEHRLAAQGLSISASSLSNWQTGRSRPERPASIEAVHAIEQLTGLPRDALVRLLGPRRARGRWAKNPPGSMRYDAIFTDHNRLSALLAEAAGTADELYRPVSVEEHVVLNSQRRYQVIHVRQLITALVDDLDRCAVFYHAEETGPLPRISVSSGARDIRIGRRREDPEAGIAVAELLLDHALGTDEYLLLEYTFRFDEPTSAPACYYRVFRRSFRQYLLRIDFDWAAVPVRCAAFHSEHLDDTPTRVQPLPCYRGRTVHHFVPDGQPGIHGVRWGWD